MTSSTFAWAWELEIPAEPKLLLIVLTEAAGMTREFDVDHVKTSKKCGIPLDDLPLVLQDLAARELLEVLAPAETPDGCTTVLLHYPTQDWEVPSAKAVGPRFNPFPGFLYVISGGEGVTKIGVTTRTRERLSALEKASGRALTLVWSLQATVTEVRGFEQRLLRMFAASRIRGEWFSATPEEVIAAAVEICGAEGVRA